MISNIDINSQSGAKCALININLVVISWKLSLHCVGVRWREPFDSRNSNIVGIVNLVIIAIIIIVVYHISLTKCAIKISMKVKLNEKNAFQVCQNNILMHSLLFIWQPKHVPEKFIKYFLGRKSKHLYFTIFQSISVTSVSCIFLAVGGVADFNICMYNFSSISLAAKLKVKIFISILSRSICGHNLVQS